MGNKTKLKKTLRGVYYLEIPENFIRITKWKEEDIIEVIPGSAVTPKKDDIILRRIL